MLCEQTQLLQLCYLRFLLFQIVCLCDLCGLAVNYFVSVVGLGWPPKMSRCTAIGELGSIGLNHG
jgi:hypothetical protein